MSQNDWFDVSQMGQGLRAEVFKGALKHESYFGDSCSLSLLTTAKGVSQYVGRKLLNAKETMEISEAEVTRVRTLGCW